MRFLVLVTLFSLSFLSIAQEDNSWSFKLDSLLASPRKIPVYEEPLTHSVKQELIYFEFASDEFESPELITYLQKTNILSVTYVFSSYKSNVGFDQNALNKKRLIRFFNSFSINSDVDWDIIVQTGAESKEEASEFFHGFVIHYREATTKESIEKEIESFKETISNANLAIEKPKVESLEEFKKRNPPPKNDEEYYWYVKKLNAHKKRIKQASKIDTSYSKVVSDTTVITVLERNSNWKNMLVVCDLTVSMSPYVSQLMVWFKLNTEKKRIKYFTFFNDGNTTTDYKKEIGRTGGIYYSKADSFDYVLEIADSCMRNTNGGDTQENDVEALIKGMAQFDNYKEVVLVADNWSNMRDYELITELDKPIRVILCGTSNSLRVQYLNLARVSSGSIHTIEKDYKGFSKYKEGEELIIGHQIFKVFNDRFVQIN